MATGGGGGTGKHTTELFKLLVTVCQRLLLVASNLQSSAMIYGAGINLPDFFAHLHALVDLGRPEIYGSRVAMVCALSFLCLLYDFV